VQKTGKQFQRNLILNIIWMRIRYEIVLCEICEDKKKIMYEKVTPVLESHVPKVLTICSHISNILTGQGCGSGLTIRIRIHKIIESGSNADPDPDCTNADPDPDCTNPDPLL
jgi:hypothetical protein